VASEFHLLFTTIKSPCCQTPHVTRGVADHSAADARSPDALRRARAKSRAASRMVGAENARARAERRRKAKKSKLSAAEKLQKAPPQLYKVRVADGGGPRYHRCASGVGSRAKASSFVGRGRGEASCCRRRVMEGRRE
jgi:hypothetical protein